MSGHLPGARERISSLVSSFEEQDADLTGGDPLGFEGYADQLADAQARSGSKEACLWGWAEIAGQRCALVVFDFSFLGGSMGEAVGEKVARAFMLARRRELPVVTVTASGGARMQEGMISLVQMAKTIEARRTHARAGLAHVTLLASPTTGGVYASFASLADIVLAEPDATVGFAGPRVVADLTGAEPPPEVHHSAFAFEHGLVDEIVAPEDQAATIARTLGALTPKRSLATEVSAPAGPQAPAETPEPGAEAPSAAERLALARHAERPRARMILDALLSDSVELRGDRTGAGDDEHVVVRVGGLSGRAVNVVAIAQDASGDGRIRREGGPMGWTRREGGPMGWTRRKGGPMGWIRPQGFRKAVRAVELAGRLRLPVVTLVDTRGADPTPDSEAGGIAVAIARTFESMLACPSPTLAVVTGEGGSGGALAMAPADRVLCWSNAVFSVIAPEGAASILYRDPGRAPELAERLGITAPDLVGIGLVDRIVPEPAGGAQTDPASAVADLVRHIAAEMEPLMSARPKARLRARHRRWRTAGSRR